MLAFLASCQQAEQKAQFIIGFSQCTGDDAWRKSMLQEMNRELAFHPEVSFLYEDAAGNNEKQIAQVRSLMQRGIDLLIISPNEAEPITPVVEEAFNKGIPVVILDRRTTSPFYTAFVGADNYEIGQIAGRYTSNMLEGQGRIAEIWGLPGSTPAIDRHNGFQEVIDDFTEIEIVTRIDGDWEMEVAKAKLATRPAVLDSIDLIYAHNDVMALAAYSAVQHLPKRERPYILGVDGLAGSNGGVQFVDEGILDATFLYPTGGKEAIQVAINILTNASFQKETILQTTVIDSSNVRIFKLQAKKVAAQQAEIERQQDMINQQLELYQDQRNLLLVISIAFLLAAILGAISLLNLRSKKEANRDLAAKNEEIKLKSLEIERMAEEKAEANRLKLEFFTNISHEFRTPLTLILAPLEQLLSTGSLPSKVYRDLGLAKKNALRLLRLINQLMDLRKIDNSKMQLKASRQDVSSFLREIAEPFEQLADQQQIAFQVLLPSREVPLWFDANMLDKVIFNLLSNAFKYTPKGGTVTLAVKDTNKVVKIQVKDTGKGLSPEEKERIFERFFRGNIGRVGGTGLGLALSKALIDLHYGKVNVNSQPGAGAIFEVILPKGREHLATHEVSTEASHPQLRDRVDLVYNYTNLETSEEAKVKTEDTSDYSILIVEDNEELLQFLEAKLARHFNTITTSDGAEGLSLAQQHLPDIILSDIMLPSMNGLELCQVIKQKVTTAHIPIVLLTAKSSIQQQIEGLQTGADDYISKPFHPDLLVERLKNILFNRNLLKERMLSGQNLVIRHNATNALDQAFVDNFIRFIEDNLNNADMTIQDICQEMAMSRVQLYRKVKALLGYSVNDYIQNLRLKRSMKLLSNLEKSISDIAYEVGFSSPSYFSTVFKNKYQQTPRDYRNKLLNEQG
ncbi:MAG: substrate-binding domain-containing protein [Bacteroidota bacterium]